MATCVCVKDAWFRFVTPECATGLTGKKKNREENLEISLSCRALFL
jgi:hypothetical protein